MGFIESLLEYVGKAMFMLLPQTRKERARQELEKNTLKGTEGSRQTVHWMQKPEFWFGV